MPRFKKQDSAKELIEIIGSEQRQLGDLDRQFEQIKQKWFEADMACAEIDALLTAQNNCYTKAAEPLFRAHQEALQREKESRIAKRDSMGLEALHGERRQLKHTISRRLSCLRGCLFTVIGAVLNYHPDGSVSRLQCSPELDADLRAASKRAEEIADPAELIAFVKSELEKIEDLDLQYVPFASVDKAVAQALKVGEESSAETAA